MIQKLLPTAIDKARESNLPLASILQRIPGILVLFIIPWSILGPLISPLAFGIYFMALHLMLLSSNIRSAYGVYIGYYSAIKTSTTDYLSKYLLKTGTLSGSDESHDLPLDTICHIIILPNYKETLETLCESLDVLSSHSRAVSQYRICLAMEEAEENAIVKAQNLVKMYTDFFFEISYTIHPCGRKGEIRGKSSNVSWAASQMALRNLNGPLGGHSHEIITIQDADTCFAEDYFSCISYYYSTASPEQRKIMMFTPCTVFDRNAGQVPVFVRATDIMWSIGVMSNLYPSSPVRIPCSAYSVSMDLALSVNFWDTGPEAIGEDLHMYLKCLFATKGKVIVKPIFSPASQCNVEGSGGSGYGVSGWISGLQARYIQSYRHLWGSLDTSYALSQSVQSWFSPESETIVKLKNFEVDKIGKNVFNGNLSRGLLFSLFYRLLEAHVVMGHLFFMLFAVSYIVPLRSYSPVSFLFGSLSLSEMNWFMDFSLYFASFIRLMAIVPNIIMIYYYEKYHQWVAVDRWRLQSPKVKNMVGRRIDSAVEISDYANRNDDLLIPQKVQHLGRRSQLVYKRGKYDVIDFAALLLSGFYFFVIPQFHAQICHLWTNSLEYKVASKPTLSKIKPLTEPEPIYENPTFVEFSIKVDSFETHSFASNRSSRGDEGFFEDLESSSDL